MLDRLPDVVLRLVLSQVSVPELLALQATCRRLAALLDARDDPNNEWLRRGARIWSALEPLEQQRRWLVQVDRTASIRCSGLQLGTLVMHALVADLGPRLDPTAVATSARSGPVRNNSVRLTANFDEILRTTVISAILHCAEPSRLELMCIGNVPDYATMHELMMVLLRLATPKHRGRTLAIDGQLLPAAKKRRR